MTDVNQFSYPPLDSQGVATFITDQGGAETGDVNTDFRNALFIAVAPGGKSNDYSIDDLWRRHIFANVYADSNAALTGIVISDPPRGQSLDTYYSTTFLANAGNANTFPGGSSVPTGNDITDFLATPVDLTHTKELGFTADGGCHVNADESRIYTINATGDAVNQWTMSTPGDITTASATTVSGTDFGRPFGVWLNEAETVCLLTHHSDDATMHTLSTPGDASTISAVVTQFDPSGTSAGLYNGTMNSDGTKFIAGGVAGLIVQVTLSTPYDLSTASVTDTYDASTQVATNLYSFGLDPSGTKIFIGDAGTEIYQYDLSTPWDLTTCAYNTTTKTFAGSAAQGRGMSWPTGGDGTEFYMMSQIGADRFTKMIPTP